jgi:hypothetical protein
MESLISPVQAQMLFSWQTTNCRKQGIQNLYQHGSEDTLLSGFPHTPTKNILICELTNLRELHIKHYNTTSRLVTTAYTSQNNIFLSVYRVKQ